MINDPRVASIPIEPRWVEEAGAELEAIPHTLFLSPMLWNAGPTLKGRIAEIVRCVLDPGQPLRLDDLAAHLDALKVNGRQVVFLWRLDPGVDLEELSRRHPDQSRLVWESKAPDPGADLEELSRRHPYQSRLVWESGAPALAEVRHLCNDGRETLRFKWVATRRYWVEQPPPAPGAPPGFVPRTQRAVSFFHIDLESGDCELRIQSLPHEGQGLPSLRQEFERYESEVGRLVDLHHLAPVRIEPLASHWLREPPLGLEVTRWSILRPSSGAGLIGTGKRQGFLPQLKLALGDYFARHATLLWNIKQRIVQRPLYFSLDGTGDCVEFNGLADASRVDFVLRTIRSDPQPPLRRRELQRLAEQYPKHARILAALDHLLARRKGWSVSAREVAADGWHDLEAIRQVFALAATKARRTFRLQGDDLILKRRFRLAEGGLAETLERSLAARGFRVARRLVQPTLALTAVLGAKVYELLVSWLGSALFERITGIPLDIVLVALWVLLLGTHVVVSFGGDSVRAALLRFMGFLRSQLRRLGLPIGRGGWFATFERMYQEYLVARSGAKAS